jgi:hypothetical protein
VSRLPEDRIARRRAKQAANTSQRSRRVAGSRRRQRAESTAPSDTTTEVEELDTGAEAWDEESTHADDLVTETEAGPLEEPDFEDDDETDVSDDTDDEVDAEGDDEVTDDTSDDASDQDEPEDEDTDGDSAEEKGK